MEEEYGRNFSFMRETTPPDRASRASSPRKARYTGASITGLRENRRSGKLEKKIERYNEEYARLSELAAQVDIDRKDVEEGKLDYAEVQKNIKAYNAQARRLAEIGVEVLVLNQDIQKITFAKEEDAKAIRVPGFLIGPLRLLTAAGREKARLEREAREEKEQAIYESIVTTAEEAIGQVKESQMDVDKFESLDFANVAKTVEGQLVEEPTTDVLEEPAVVEEKPPVVEEPVETTVEKTPEELAEEARARETAAAEAVAKRNEAISEGLRNAYRNVPNPKKKRETEAAVKKAVEGNDYLAVLANVNASFGIALHKESKRKLLESHVNGERRLVTPSEIGMMSGLTDKDEIKVAYANMIAISEFASYWNRNATYEVQESETSVRCVEAFSEENSTLFNFVVAAVREGMTAEEIREKAASELSEIEANVVGSVVADLDVVKAGITALDAMMVTKAKEDTLEEEPVVEVDVAKRREAVDSTLARLAAEKYGLNRAAVEDEPVVGDDEVVSEEKVETEEIAPEVRPMEGGYVSQIGVLVSDISELTAHRNRLREILGDEASEQLAALDAAISNKLAQINALALGGIVNLGKDSNPLEAVNEEEVAVAFDEEDPVVEEESPVVLPDAASIEMSIEEKAEIDARVVNGAHVKVDAIIENFIPGKKYVLEARVKGKKATLVVEDEDALEAEIENGDDETAFVASEEEPALENSVVEDTSSLEEVVNGDEEEAVVVSDEDPVLENSVVNATTVLDEETVVENPTLEAPASTVVEDDSDYYDRGIMSDEEKDDAIAWWSMMAPTLDNPDFQEAQRLLVARKEAELAAERADITIERGKWEANRDARIADGWLPTDEEARTKRIADQERVAEQIARSKLRKCRYFEGLDDFDSYIDGIIAESDDLNNARDVVSMLEKNAPQAFQEMEERYRADKLATLGNSAEMTEGRSK